MSLVRCDKCKIIIDTDAEPESCVDFEQYGCDFLCVGCQDDIDNLKDNMGD